VLAAAATSRYVRCTELVSAYDTQYATCLQQWAARLWSTALQLQACGAYCYDKAVLEAQACTQLCCPEV
jgi:hypothetical protein